MDTTNCTPALEVLSDEELEAVVGGTDTAKTRDAVMNKIGMCGCGLAH